MGKKEFLEIQEEIFNELVKTDSLPIDIQNYLKEYAVFRYEIMIESDRGCALLAASYLDSLLEKMLRNKMIGTKKHLDNLFDFNGPLGSFSSRISLSYSIGLLSKQHHNDLQIIRKIRNTFGHSPLIIDFDDIKIKSQCSNLKLVLRENSKTPRQKFNTSVAYLLGVIEGMNHIGQPFLEKFNEELENSKKIANKFDSLVAEIFKNNLKK